MLNNVEQKLSFRLNFVPRRCCVARASPGAAQLPGEQTHGVLEAAQHWSLRVLGELEIFFEIPFSIFHEDSKEHQ